MPVQLTCAFCGKTFKVRPYELTKRYPRKYCSNECYWKSGTPKPKQKKGTYKKCPVCGKEFYAKPSQANKRFCSKKCAATKGPLLTCKVCGKQYRRNPWAVKNLGSSCCSIECRDKARIGYVPSEETRRKLSIALKGKMVGKNNPRYGKTPPKLGYGKRMWYKDVLFRSTYEVRFAKALDMLGIPWQYEPKRFEYTDSQGRERTYLIDFYLPQQNLWVEVKGYVTEEDKEMLKALRNEGLNILLATLQIIRMFEASASKGGGLDGISASCF